MDHYLDIQLVPNAELPTHVMLSVVYGHLHRVLARDGRRDVGVSFPNVGRAGLGDVLRLHGSLDALLTMVPDAWLRGARDYIRWNGPEKVPARTLHCAVRRVQAKSSPERLRRRQIRRHGWTQDEARERIPDRTAVRLQDPFVRLYSTSTGQAFLLFVRHEAPQALAVQGTFNSYGLSRTATVPWFPVGGEKGGLA